MPTVADELTEDERRTLADLARRAGREAVDRARDEGKQIGRPRVITPQDDAEIRRMKEQGLSARTIGDLFGIDRSSVYRSLRRSGGQS